MGRMAMVGTTMAMGDTRTVRVSRVTGSTMTATGGTTTRHDDGNARHGHGDGQQDNGRHNDGTGQHSNGRHDDGDGQQSDRRHDNGDERHDDAAKRGRRATMNGFTTFSSGAIIPRTPLVWKIISSWPTAYTHLLRRTHKTTYTYITPPVPPPLSPAPSWIFFSMALHS